MDKSNHASVEFAMAWKGPHADHRDKYYFDKINFRRDHFPGDIGDRLCDIATGASIAGSFEADALLPPGNESNVHEVSPSQINLKRLLGAEGVRPQKGRFYPRGIITGLADTFPQDRRPFRYLGQNNAKAFVDFNHPLSGYVISCEARLVKRLVVSEERGGRCNDVVHDVAENGPGMQTGREDMETDYFSGSPFRRVDEYDDARFYESPRFVHHIDAVARQQIQGIYARFLEPQMKVLDLMSSCTSHLPDRAKSLSVTGLGMNQQELASNEHLCDYVVHDLNHNPVLPFGENEFDAVLCTVSVEYLTNPIEVFKDVARVSKPEAPFIVTFSERWFPPKVVQVWTELHPFERMGLVLEYFRRSASFTMLSTESMRGLFRPRKDQYYGVIPFSDPVYAVWGRATK